MIITDFYKKKMNGEKITFITCYDYTSARILSDTEVDGLLVGDTLAMTMYGYKDTLSATIDLMCWNTQAVSRGAHNKFILGDMPFLSYRKSLSHSVSAVQKIMQAGAHAIKLEGAHGNIKLVRHLVESGIPVMGHIGLTPQSVCAMGGYKVQGKTKESANQIKEEAYALQEAGCFSIVLECVPRDLAKEITTSLSIPTIGIGAGSGTDGQVLVFQDLLGLTVGLKPKFVKTYLNGGELIQSSVNTYVQEVKSGDYPSYEYSYDN